MKERLLDRLAGYRDSDYYPFHMPGHKRNMPEEIAPLKEAAGLDITEIEGFDNLHQPEEVLKTAQEEAARVFGAEETLFLVNGSTAGILTAVSAAAPKGSRVIVARNCHKSVYHAIFLRELVPVFLYPDTVPDYGIADALRPEQVAEVLAKYPDAAAVILTSPTYDGVVSDVEAIAKAVHAAGALLIVDAAHGAHFGFAEGWPESPVRLGADLVIQSLHKTLPALTQTALLHVSGKLADRERVRQFEGIYQTSSPSYVLMGSIDACVRLMVEQGRQRLEEFSVRLNEFERKTAGMKALKLMNTDILEKGCMKAHDRGKLLITAINGKKSGNCLYKELLNRYHLQMEMVCDTYVTAIVTPWDTQEGLDRLADALLEMDGELASKTGEACGGTEAESGKAGRAAGMRSDLAQQDTHTGPQPGPYPVLETAVSLHKAAGMPGSVCPLGQAAGRVSGTYINLYPPGIPLVIPGEILTEEAVRLIEGYLRQGLNVQGLEWPEGSSGESPLIRLLDVNAGMASALCPQE